MNIAMRAALLALAAGFAASAIAQGQPEGAAASPPPGGDANAAAAATPPQERTKVFAGAGLGGGFGARYKVNGTTITFNDRLQGAPDKGSLVAVNVASFGIALRPGLYAGFDLGGFGQGGTVAGDKTFIEVINYFGALTWFPWESGLYLRAGAGLSSLLISQGSQSDHASGLGVLVAAGYALQLSGSHHLTFTVEQSWQSYGGSSATKPDSSQVGGVFLGYMWKP